MGRAIWEEPVRGDLFPDQLRGLSGIEQLRLFLSGHVGRPPIGRLTGMHPTEVGVGTATFTMPITGWLQAPQGTVTGGAVAILADGPLGCAIQTALPPATGYTIRPLLHDAWAKRGNLTIADALYVTLAEHVHATLVTADMRIVRAPGLTVAAIHP